MDAEKTAFEIMISLFTSVKGFAQGACATVFAYLLSYVIPTQAIMNGLFLFIVADLITGSMVSMKNGMHFEWAKAVKTILKFILYPLAVIIAHVYETDFATAIPMTSVVAGVIGLFELKSVYTNMSVLLGYDLVGMVWEKIKHLIDEKINPKP